MTAVVVSSFISMSAPWAAMLVGFVLVLVTARRHPRRSTLAATGLAVLLLVGIGRVVILNSLYAAEGSAGQRTVW